MPWYRPPKCTSNPICVAPLAAPRLRFDQPALPCQGAQAASVMLQPRNVRAKPDQSRFQLQTNTRSRANDKLN
jgi:hypothetical protein